MLMVDAGGVVGSEVAGAVGRWVRSYRRSNVPTL